MRYSYSWHWSTETANHACHRPGPAPICCIRPVSIGSGHDGDGDSRALVLINQSALHGRPFRKSGFRDADRTVRPSRSFRSQIRWGSNASNAVSASFLVSAVQISCSARLAFDCWLFGSFVRNDSEKFFVRVDATAALIRDCVPSRSLQRSCDRLGYIFHIDRLQSRQTAAEHRVDWKLAEELEDGGEKSVVRSEHHRRAD